MNAERSYWNPYVAGVALGLVLLGTFLVFGFGLGSSSAVSRLAYAAVDAVAPQAAAGNAYLAGYVGGESGILVDWMVFEVLGVLLGGFVAAYTAGRMKLGIDRGVGVRIGTRLAMAVAGGVLMGFAARLARGCTSGQALTGGATLAVGSWIFMMAVFAGGYAVAPMVRRMWR